MPGGVPGKSPSRSILDGLPDGYRTQVAGSLIRRMARRLVVPPQSELDILNSTFKPPPSGTKTSGSVWACVFSTNSICCSGVSNTIHCNSREWKARFAGPSSATFLMVCTSLESQTTSGFWRFCTCIENQICGRAGIECCETKQLQVQNQIERWMDSHVLRLPCHAAWADGSRSNN